MTTTLESSSAVESSMEEDTSQTLTTTTAKRARNGTTGTAQNHRFNGCENNNNKSNNTSNGDGEDNDDDDGDDADEECDAEAWETLRKSFRQVQTVLDQNRALIQQVNENHQSKLHDNLVKNVSLIREINGNISKVIGLYSDLSVDFTSIVHQRRALTSTTTTKNSSDSSNNDNNDKAESSGP